MDLVVHGGEVSAVPGGAPFNVARACARLGAEVALWSTVSTDGFGERLMAALAGDGVNTTLIGRVDDPTPLALAELAADGSASYRFYLAMTALTGVPEHRQSVAEAAVQAAVAASGVMVTGGLALVVEPMATRITEMLSAIRANRGERPLIVIDVNARPDAIDDVLVARQRIEQVLGLADVVKLSDEDAAVLWPDRDIDAAIAAVLETGVAVVIVTAGSDPVQIHWGEHSRVLAVPDLPGPLLDTIGAGDAFVAGLVTWWATHGVPPAQRTRAVSPVSDSAVSDSAVSDSDVSDPEPDGQWILEAVWAASIVAGVVCTRRGAEVPQRSELPSPW